MLVAEIRGFSAASCLVGSGTEFFSNVFEEKLFFVVFVEKQMGKVIFSGSALTTLWSKFVKILNFMIWFRGTREIGLGVCSGMVGCWRTPSPGLRLLRIFP